MNGQGACLIGTIGAIGLCTVAARALAQAPNPAPPGFEALKSTLRQELAIAEEQGYIPHATEELIKQGEAAAQEARRVRHEGANSEQAEVLGREARRRLLWAKGALLDLKLPVWAHDVRYYGPGDGGAVDPDRGVVFPGTDFWALPGAYPGQWFRGHCRPDRGGPARLEALRLQGKRVGTYMSGGMIPITYALLPPSEEDWSTDFMRRYAGGYWWHGERWWGATGDKPGFREWMLPQLEFAHEAGFDFVHLDEAWGGYPEARAFNDAHPGFLTVTNNFGMTYVDQESFRFGWTAMGEGAGSPHDWDSFRKNLRERGLAALNLTTWSYLYYQLDDPEFYHDLAYATAIANKTTDVSLGSPSRPYVVFAHRFCDYLFGPYVDIDVPQNSVQVSSATPSVRTCLTRRFLPNGTEERIVHLLNIDPKVQQTGEVAVTAKWGKSRLPAKPVATFMSPEQPPQELAAELHRGSITFKVPGVKVWGIAVIGERLLPRVSLALTSRCGGPPRHPFDNSVVPGEEFEVEARAERLAPTAEEYRLRLNLPTGWRAREVGATKDGGRRFVVSVPADAGCDRGWAITPVVARARGEMPSFPLQVETKQRLTFRLFPPCIDSPAPRPTDFELEVKDNSAQGSATVAIALPEGWQADPKESEIDISPGESKRLPLSLAAPDMGATFWYHRDAPLEIKWRLGAVAGTSTVQVRVFPALFSVYHAGVETLIMHGYPNLYPRGDDFEAAKRALESGEHVVLWLVDQDPARLGPLVDRFLSRGGGVVWMGQPFPGENCPVALEAEGGQAGSVLLLGGEAWPQRLAAPVLPFRGYYESEKRFQACKVCARNWAAVAAVWGPGGEKPGLALEGTPAVVVSSDPSRRVAYIGSDLETTTEDSYRFEDRLHRESHWYLTYYFYHLLAWAAGAET